MRAVKHFFLIALMAILFEGCKKDDPAPNIPLEGTWIFKSYVFANCTDPIDNDSGTCTVDCEKFIFKSDETGTLDYADPTDTDMDFTYTISGNTITICDPTDCYQLTFSISGSNLTVSLDDQDTGCEETMIYQKT